MNWQAIGAAGEVLGAIAVLLTLIYLTLQIRQNTKATRLQTAQATHQFSADGVSLLANVDTAVIWSKFIAEGYKPLSAHEQVVVGAVARVFFTSWDNHYYQYLRGSLENEVHSAFENRMIRQLAIPAIFEWWQHNKVIYTKSFGEYVDGLIERRESVG